MDSHLAEAAGCCVLILGFAVSAILVAHQITQKLETVVEPSSPTNDSTDRGQNSFAFSEAQAALSASPEAGEAPATVEQMSATEPLHKPVVAQSADAEFSSRIGISGNLGFPVFMVFAVLSFVVAMFNGLVPLYLLETLFWAVLAWYWRRKKIAGQGINLAVAAVAVLVIAGESFAVGRSGGAHSYTYLKEGNVQFRADTSEGRTDRLGNNGWSPVSFDQPATAVPVNSLGKLGFSDGHWYDGLQKICFSVENETSFVIADVTVEIMLTPISAQPATSPTVYFIDLKPDYGADLLDRGKESVFCAAQPRTFPADASWSYNKIGANGWETHRSLFSELW